MQAGLFGVLGSLGTVSQVVLVILLLFSVVSWAVIFSKWRGFRACDADDEQFLHMFRRTQDLEEVRRFAGRVPASPSAAVFLGVAERLDPRRNGGALGGRTGDAIDDEGADVQYAERTMAHVLQGQLAKQETYLPFLATTGSITPFIGLLGTVMGIIDAFAEIGKQGTASIAAVAPGVAEALVATAAGLFTAIPAVMAYNYFLTRIRKAAFRTEAFNSDLLHLIKARAKPVGVRG